MSDSESQVSQDHKENNKNKANQGGYESSTSKSTSAESENPFKVPNDALIFTFKEDEKKRKANDKESNKHLRIWEKNRPAREGCLRKLCETEIEPSALAINPKMQSKVQVQDVNGFTVPTERNKNKENRYKLIEKKREMALVEMML